MDKVAVGRSLATWELDSVSSLMSVYGLPVTCLLQLISPIDGVMDEHFIVWMRTAAVPTFRNLYGRIEHDLIAPAEITFNVTASELSD